MSEKEGAKEEPQSAHQQEPAQSTEQQQQQPTEQRHDETASATKQQEDSTTPEKRSKSKKEEEEEDPASPHTPATRTDTGSPHSTSQNRRKKQQPHHEMTPEQREIIRRRIYNMFHKYIPSKLYKVDDAMIRYEGKHIGFIHALVEKFGPEPPLDDGEEKRLDDDIKQSKMKAARKASSRLALEKRSSSRNTNSNESSEGRVERLREKYAGHLSDSVLSQEAMLSSDEERTPPQHGVLPSRSPQKNGVVALPEDHLHAANLALFHRTQLFDAERSQRAKICDEDRRTRLKIQVAMSDHLRAVILDETERNLRVRMAEERAAVRKQLEELNERKELEEIERCYVAMLDDLVKTEMAERVILFNEEHLGREELRHQMSTNVAMLYKRAIRHRRETKKAMAVDREQRIQQALEAGQYTVEDSVRVSQRPGGEFASKQKRGKWSPERERREKLEEQRRKDEYLFELQVQQRHKILNRMEQRRHEKAKEVAARIVAEQRVQMLLTRFQNRGKQEAKSIQRHASSLYQIQHPAADVPVDDAHYDASLFYLNSCPRRNFPIEAHKARYATLLPPILPPPKVLVQHMRQQDAEEDELEKEHVEQEREQQRQQQHLQKQEEQTEKANEGKQEGGEEVGDEADQSSAAPPTDKQEQGEHPEAVEKQFVEESTENTNDGTAAAGSGAPSQAQQQEQP